ncbi:hypothetical protein [Acrocarpospora macrocephala]|uniref:hypothetical protein n=1 Tax=Acrocarpospora macrocephala TaxID=150177 RepID=UPI001FE3D1A6|nr:hypothetical protein [Acrocarpospora macrocephala]
MVRMAAMACSMLAGAWSAAHSAAVYSASVWLVAGSGSRSWAAHQAVKAAHCRV